MKVYSILKLIKTDSLQLLIYSLLIGFTNSLFPVLVKLGRKDLNLFQFTFVWYALSSLFYLIFIFIQFKMQKNITNQMKIIFMCWKSIFIFLIVNSFALFLLYYSLEYLNTNTFTFFLGAGIIFNILISIFLLEEKEHLNLTLLSVLIILIGFTFLRYSLSNIELQGILYIVIATFLFAITNFIIKKKLGVVIHKEKINNSIIGALKSFFIFFISAIILILNNDFVFIANSKYLYLILGAFVGPFIGYIFVLKVLREYGLNSLVIYKSSEYSFAAIFGILVFNQFLNIVQIVGVILILSGIILYNHFDLVYKK